MPTTKFASANSSFTRLRAGFGLKAADGPVLKLPEDFPLKRRLEPMVVLLMGRRGRGKTLGMTWFAEFQRRRMVAQGNHCRTAHPLATYGGNHHCGTHFRVASNFWMEPADLVNPELVAELCGFPDWGRNLELYIDELGAYAANRRSMSAGNVNLMQFLTQIRKRDCEMMATTQFPQWLDMGVLYQIDLFCKMDLYKGFREWVIDVDCWDWFGQYTGRDHRKAWPPRPEDVDWSFRIHHAEAMVYDTAGRLRPMFDTAMIQPPSWAKNRDTVVMREWGEGRLDQLDIGYQPPEPEEEATIRTPAAWEDLRQLVGVAIADGHTFQWVFDQARASIWAGKHVGIPKAQMHLEAEGFVVNAAGLLEQKTA